MDVELVAVGTELVLGFTTDTNGAALARRLAARGIRVARRTAVPDDAAAIRSAVEEALSRTGLVITTGGLGPTSDDCTLAAVAAVFHADLAFDPSVWEAIRERFRRLGREPHPSNRRQAMVPVGATVLPNRWGTAPGIWLEGQPGTALLLPGVPYELEQLLENEVLPRLTALRPGGEGGVIRSLTVRTTALPESAVSARVRPLEEGLAPLTLAYLPGPEGVDLRLTAWDLPPDRADALLAGAAARLEDVLGGHAYGRDEADLAAVLLDALRARGWRLAVGESCTGGMLGARITAVPGSSEVFVGGAVCYDNRAKVEQLDVPSTLLDAHGAVSTEVALAMARGAASRFGAQAALGVTGIAGPGGGSEAKPVGTVCFGWVAGETPGVAGLVVPGNRREVRERAAQYALYRLWQAVAATEGRRP